MNRAKGRWRLLTIAITLLLLTYALWPRPVRPAILFAYSDNALGMWGLTLFKDGQFDLTLPASYENGRFKLSADTVLLQYDEPTAGLPAAYLINRTRNQVEELSRIAGKWTVTHRGNWAEIHYDSTRYYNH